MKEKFIGCFLLRRIDPLKESCPVILNVSLVF
jgi:hypothetical protein